MNNKGVTLVELLIVIVVLGIISAFAIPAVGGIIDNTNKGAVYNDALQVENAAKLYCQQETCVNGSTTLKWSVLGQYISNLDTSYYEDVTGVDANDAAIASLNASGNWIITLERTGAGTAADNEWEWVNSTNSPSNLSKDSVTDEATE